jgi:crotonobetainyl-CoA:carnitine CoA-transferase CaiB-like acyl-CoA transferase
MNNMVGSALSALDWHGTDDDSVDVRHWDPSLQPSTLPVMEAMAAAVTASTVAASVLDSVRTGDTVHHVSVNARHVAVAARSERYAHKAGDAPSPNLFAPLSRFWQTADGWLRLHTNYEWHRSRALAVLDCGEQPAEVAAAVRTWRGDELESALDAAGALGYVVRTRSDWNAHPQGRAAADQPLLDWSQPRMGKIIRRMARPGRFAEDLRVLDLTRVIAGPVATKTLAAWGADVLRIDSPRLPEIPGQALDMLPGKRSALLDFEEPEGRKRLQELLARADVLVHGYRPGALDRYGLGKDALTERHPHLIAVQLSAWGLIGPWSTRRGFDSLVQCATGIAAAESVDDRPGALPAQALDHATGYLAAAASLLSLARREQGEEAAGYVSLSLAKTADWLFRNVTGELQASRSGPPVPPDDYYVTLSGADQPVRLIGPPGQVGDVRPKWDATAEYGSGAPEFGPRREVCVEGRR